LKVYFHDSSVTVTGRVTARNELQTLVALKRVLKAARKTEENEAVIVKALAQLSVMCRNFTSATEDSLKFDRPVYDVCKLLPLFLVFWAGRISLLL